MRAFFSAILAIAFVPSVLFAGPGAKTARCFLKVDGRAYLDKPCRFEVQSDGSFSIGTAAIDSDKREPFFAIVNITGPGTADAFWNEDASSTHAQTELGVVKRHGPCWTNVKVEICAR